MLEFAAFYFLFCLCFVFPPSAFISAGLTVPSICSQWLGSEGLQFVQYHVKRICATLIFHSLLPLGFFVGITLIDGTAALTTLLGSSIGFYMFQLALLLPIAVSSLVYYWYANEWSNHPIVNELKTYCTDYQWTEVAAEINTEFRRIDKVCVSTSPIIKTVITSTWIVKVLPYTLRIAKQSHVTLTLEGQEEHQLSLDDPAGTQYLNIKVEFSHQTNETRPKSFTIRLKASDYQTIQDRLHQPIQNIRGLVVHSTIESRFIQVFVEEVQRNPTVTTSEDLEPCIGCMNKLANIRLVRRCELSNEGPSCTPCFCRPMWCVECLAKWFAARQDQDHPEQWLSSRSPCPTCRNLFCLLDVSLVEKV